MATDNTGSNTKIATGMLAELENENATTRRFLDRVPGDKLDWRPHDKSMTCGQLAHHIASIQKGVLSLALSENPTLPDFGETYQPAEKSEILNALNESIEYVSKTLPSVDDARMHSLLQIKKDGKIVMELPLVGFIRAVMLNHLYHHRGQLGVYLRLIGVAVPWSYGPSGDEAPFN